MKRILAIPALALLVAAQAPQEDPLKELLKVGEWYGNVVLRVRGEGRKVVPKENACYSFSVDRRLDVDFRIEGTPGEIEAMEAFAKNLSKLPLDGLPPEARKQLEKSMSQRHWMRGKKKEQTVQASISDRRHGCGQDACALDGNPFQTWSISKTGSVRREDRSGAMLQVDVAAKTFDLTVTWDDRIDLAVERTGSGKIAGPSRETSRVLDVVIDLRGRPLPKPGVPWTGTIDVSDKAKSLAPDYGKVTATLEWTLTPTPPEPLELVVSIPGHETWLPEAKPDGGPGDPRLPVTAVLRRKGGGEPKDEIERATFRLEDVSDEPGVAGNFPKVVPPTELRDLAFEPAQGIEFPDPSRTTAVARNCGRKATVSVASHDWGAFGMLTVEAVTKTGRVLTGFLESKPAETRIPLPKRTSPSRIADAWKDKLGFSALDESDEDPVPKGNGFAGDGLTLFEEYRGFYHEGKHFRSNPVKKDLFILDLNKDPRVRKGIDLFASLSELEVHSKTFEDEMLGRRVNFNSRECRIVEQHGVVVDKFDPTLVDVAGGVGPGAGKERTTPKDYEKIRIASNLVTKTAKTIERGGATVMGADPVETTIAHELFHTVNVSHHGQSDDAKVKWSMRKNPDGTWTHSEGAKSIRLKRIDGTPYPYSKEVDGEVYLGKKGGLFSGHADCVMRYTNADAVVDPADPAWRIDVRGLDLEGRGLCSSAKGTGINGAGGPLGGLFGDATKGNCKAQICVSDRYK